MHAFPTNKNGANESVKCSCSCALCSFTLVSIDVELPFVQHEKRKDYPARTAHALPIHSNERTRYLTHCPRHRASWAVRFHSREEDNAPSHSRSRSHSHACMHTYLRLSVSLSLCPRTHCAPRIPIWTDRAGSSFPYRAFHRGIGRNCIYRRASTSLNIFE